MNQPPGGNGKPFQGTQLMANAPIPGYAQQQIAQAQQAQAAQTAYQPSAPAGWGAPPAAPAPQPGWAGAAQQGMQAPAAQGYPQGAQGYAPQGAQGYAPQGQAQAPMGQAPGAPQAQQGSGLPQFGVAGFGRNGMPRIAVGGGDFSPGKLVAAVTTGQGFAAPRKMGLTMVGLGFAFAVVNSILVFVLHLYYPYLYSLGAIFWWGGLWLAVTGQPASRPDGTPAPGWARAGLAVSLGMGLLVGIAMIFFNWEHVLL